MNFALDIRKLYHERKKDSVKSDFGRSLLLGGSLPYPNALVIASSLAHLSGNGYTALGVPRSIYPILACRVYPTLIFEPSEIDGDFLFYGEETWKRIMKTYDAILVGNGIRDCKENEEVLVSLLKEYEGNLIIDATGLSILSGISLTSYRPKVLLTPHLGEAGRLFKMKSHSRKAEDYLPSAREFISSHKCNILLKSNQSIYINEKGEVYPCLSSSVPALAKAGSGDGLAGYLVGLLAYSDKIIGFDETVLFADKMIHEAALSSQKELSSGVADILSSAEKVKEIISEAGMESEGK